MASTLYWHDYETFGADPKRNRPAQFAGLRTDETLNEIGEPLIIYCQPARDVLPHPEACLLTGITPQIAESMGLIEPEFIARIHAELAQPGTCGVGYNTLRFDDEVTRYALYRNFYDPYAREWQNSNSRWDLIDLVRMTYALRPEGISWPMHEEGRPSFRLEDITKANGIGHEAAHDALSDVRATISLARLLRDQQPRLYDWLFQLRNKHKAAVLLDLHKHTPVLHTTRMYPAETGCTSLVMPLITEPRNNNSILVYDLRYDPAPFMTMNINELNENLFTRSEELPKGKIRLPIKSVKINKCPALAPRNTLDEAGAERIAIDLGACHQHWQQLLANKEFFQRVMKAYTMNEFAPSGDVDSALYEGFISEADRPLLQNIHKLSPQKLAHADFDFHDKRLPELFFRYRARNWPETLTEDETLRWEATRLKRLNEPDGAGSITLQTFTETVTSLRVQNKDDKNALAILDAMDAWKEKLL